MMQPRAIEVCRASDVPVADCASPLAVGAATRPLHAGEENGDAFVVKHWAQSTLVGVIDGLGHGQAAHLAAWAAQQCVESDFDLPLGRVFLGADRACHGTRGAVMALARFDWAQGRLEFASVGNIEARVFPRSEALRLPVRRGVLGLGAPGALVTQHNWPPSHLLVLHSDGLSTDWGEQCLQDLGDQPAPALAQELMRLLAKGDDDATVIVVRSAMG